MQIEYLRQGWHGKCIWISAVRAGLGWADVVARLDEMRLDKACVDPDTQPLISPYRTHTPAGQWDQTSALLRTIRVRNTPLGTVSNECVRNITLREWCAVPALRSILLVMWCAESQAWSEKNGQPGSSLSTVNQSALEISNVSLTSFSELGQPKSTFCIVKQSALDISTVNETVWLSQIEIAGPMKKDTVNQFSFDK